MIPISAATASPFLSPDGHAWHVAASENREKPLEHSEQNGPSCPRRHPAVPPPALVDPLQPTFEGQGRARSDELSLRQNPGFRLALAKITPARSQTNPAGHFVQQVGYSVDRTFSISPLGSFCVHVPSLDTLAKNPIWQTHVGAPLITVVSPIPQLMHASAPPLENSLMPQVRHSDSPAFEKVPPLHDLQWLLRVRPSSSKNVPAGHSLHFVPFSVSRYCPFAHGSHFDFWAALIRPGTHERHVLLVFRYVPGSHAVQRGSPALLLFPGLHGMHTDVSAFE